MYIFVISEDNFFEFSANVLWSQFFPAVQIHVPWCHKCPFNQIKHKPATFKLEIDRSEVRIVHEE